MINCESRVQSPANPIVKELFDHTEPTVFKYHVDINKDPGILDLMIQWCMMYVQHDWGWHIEVASGDHTQGVYRFYFSDDKEYTAFALKWC